MPDQIPDSHTVVLRAAARGDADINVMVNAYWDNLIFTIQAPGSGSWIHRWQPFDILDVTTSPSAHDTRYAVAARSIVVLAIPSHR